jgi:uncharacterized protein (DUF4415 family)
MSNVSDDDDFDSLPDDFLEKARPAREVLEEDFGKKNAELLMKKKVGRPRAESPKQQITLRLDPDIIEEFRSHGKGWHSEINEALHYWIENRPE